MVDGRRYQCTLNTVHCTVDGRRDQCTLNTVHCTVDGRRDQYTQDPYKRDAGIKLDYAKLIISRTFLSEIDRVKICVQIYRKVNKYLKCKQLNTINGLILF